MTDAGKQGLAGPRQHVTKYRPMNYYHPILTRSDERAPVSVEFRA